MDGDVGACDEPGLLEAWLTVEHQGCWAGERKLYVPWVGTQGLVGNQT